MTKRLRSRGGSRAMLQVAVGALLLQLAWALPAAAASTVFGNTSARCLRDADCGASLVCVGTCQRGCRIDTRYSDGTSTRIEKTFYANGTRNPQNPCQVCQSATNRYGWSNTAAGTTCGGAPSGACDAQNTCNGAGTCTENYLPPTTVCRASAGTCDVAETCTGTSKSCPSDAFKPNTTECRASAGICDVAESCTGSAAACPSDGFQSSATVCRGSAGVCDVAESCTGTSVACPTDTFLASSTTCRASAGECDVAENCTGASAACPTDALKASGTQCRAAADVCDVAESCTGASTACPTDAFKASGTQCRFLAGECDVPESCTGASAACPADAFSPASTVCRASRGVCDLAEKCTGSFPTCPIDVLSYGNVCRAAAGVCDKPEYCDLGGNFDCPPDELQPAGYECAPPLGVCNQPHQCNGTDATTCRDPGTVPPATVCRPAANDCDVEDTCSLAFNNPNYPNCRDDVRKPDGTICVTASSTAGTCTGGQCEALGCKYTIECPDGYACSNGQCVQPAAQSFGAACTGAASGAQGTCGSGLVCCAGMYATATDPRDGAQAGPGQAGRCLDCCNSDACAGFCCDGKCRNTETSETHCGGCAYPSGGGFDCIGNLNACYPTLQGVKTVNGTPTNCTRGTPGCSGCYFGNCIFAGNTCPVGSDCILPAVPNCVENCGSDIFCYSRCTIGDPPDPRCFDAANNFAGCVPSCIDRTIDQQPCTSAPCGSDSDCCPVAPHCLIASSCTSTGGIVGACPSYCQP